MPQKLFLILVALCLCNSFNYPTKAAVRQPSPDLNPGLSHLKCLEHGEQSGQEDAVVEWQAGGTIEGAIRILTADPTDRLAMALARLGRAVQGANSQ